MKFKEGKYYYENNGGKDQAIFKILKIHEEDHMNGDWGADWGADWKSARVTVISLDPNTSLPNEIEEWALYSKGDSGEGSTQRECPELVGLAAIDLGRNE